MTTQPSLAKPLPELIRQVTPSIVERFIVEIRESGLPPRPLRRDQLLEALSEYLEELAAAVEARGREDAASFEATSRWCIGYELRSLILEYGVLYRCIVAAIEEAAGALPSARAQDIRDFLDRGVAQAAALFTERSGGDVIAALGRARQTSEARDEALSLVSHDLRNPLQVIQSSADLLHDELGSLVPDLEADLKRPVLALALERIQRAASSMDKLIADMVDLARLNAGEILLECGDHTPREMIAAACASAAREAEQRGVTLRLDRAEAGLVVCDRTRILQVLDSLVANAVKHAPARSAVTVGCWRTQSSWVFSVRDLGSGIPTELVPRLFEPFAATGAGHAGTGLGLAIAKRLVDLHQGKIWVESKPGKGASFFFRLPSPAAF